MAKLKIPYFIMPSPGPKPGDVVTFVAPQAMTVYKNGAPWLTLTMGDKADIHIPPHDGTIR